MTWPLSSLPPIAYRAPSSPNGERRRDGAATRPKLLKAALLLIALASIIAAYLVGWDRGETSGAAQVLGSSVRYVRERCTLPEPSTSQPL